MLKNYFTTAINNLLKNKLYSAINIIGLAIGLTACILIMLFVKDELSYDKQWEKADLIYRINNKIRMGDNPATISSGFFPAVLPSFKKYFSEDIEFGTRINKIEGDIQIGDAHYPASVSKVDKDFVNIFQCEALSGNLKSTLQNPNNIALNDELAVKYFGNRDPVGQTITFITGYGTKVEYKVTAIYRFVSSNTTLDIPCFSLLNLTGIPTANSNIVVETYIRLNETADIEKINKRLPDYIDNNIPSSNWPIPPGKKLSDMFIYFLQKMRDIYFNPVSTVPMLTLIRQVKTGNMTAITIFIIISVLVLIIGCINFIILTTVKATQRAREVAIRKVVGARFKQLFFQFLGESMLIALFAFIIAVTMTELILPFFELIVSKKLTVPYTSLGSYVFIMLLLIFTGLSGGFYPAFVLSRFSPTKALKSNQATDAGGSFKLRNVLVIFQFSASIVLIIATVVAWFQLLYMSKHDPGFNPDNLIVVEGIDRPEIKKYRNTLQQELLKLPGIKNIGMSSLQPNLVGMGIQMRRPFRAKTDRATSNRDMPFNCISIDYNFFETYKISLLSGRYFTQGIDQEEPTPDFSNPQKENNEQIKERRIIINLVAARQLGFFSADEAVGKILEFGDPGSPVYSEYTIIGVVADSQYRNLRLKPEPETYLLNSDSFCFLTARYQGDYQTTVKEVKRVWHKVVGDYTLSVSNVKQNLAETFTREKREKRVLIAFAVLSIFIACMGLLGIAAFTVERRVKEIGLRKVMGAKVKDIVNLLGWNFLKPVFIANIIAWPVAIYAMQSWLERFPYRFNSLYMIPICLCSGFIALLIAWFTVAGNTKRVAKSSPIKALRYE